MRDARDVAVVLLAAGLSRRFGAADKLMAPYLGKPLIQHGLDLLARFPFGERIAVIRPGAAELAPLLSAAGYRLILNPIPHAGRGHSLALGVGAIDQCATCLIWLADMPWVTGAHIEALLRAEGTAVASELEGVRQPPALFARAHFAALKAATGDQGARALMRRATAVPAPTRILHDVDCPQHLMERGTCAGSA